MLKLHSQTRSPRIVLQEVRWRAIHEGACLTNYSSPLMIYLIIIKVSILVREWALGRWEGRRAGISGGGAANHSYKKSGGTGVASTVTRWQRGG
jgi:hypothetical protein